VSQNAAFRLHTIQGVSESRPRRYRHALHGDTRIVKPGTAAANAVTGRHVSLIGCRRPFSPSAERLDLGEYGNGDEKNHFADQQRRANWHRDIDWRSHPGRAARSRLRVGTGTRGAIGD
jgi:hypothetical protein